MSTHIICFQLLTIYRSFFLMQLITTNLLSKNVSSFVELSNINPNQFSVTLIVFVKLHSITISQSYCMPHELNDTLVCITLDISFVTINWDQFLFLHSSRILPLLRVVLTSLMSYSIPTSPRCFQTCMVYYLDQKFFLKYSLSLRVQLKFLSCKDKFMTFSILKSKTTIKRVQ